MRADEVAEASGLHRGQLSRPSWWCHERHWYAAVAEEIAIFQHGTEIAHGVTCKMTLAPKLRPIKISLTDRELLLPFAGNDIGPQRLDVGWLKQIAPWRHVVFAVAHRIGEARILLGRKRAQIETAPRI